MSVAQIPASKHAPDWPTNIFPVRYWLIKPKKEEEKWRGKNGRRESLLGKQISLDMEEGLWWQKHIEVNLEALRLLKLPAQQQEEKKKPGVLFFTWLHETLH